MTIPFDRSNNFQSNLFLNNVLAPYLLDYRNVTNFARFTGGSNAVIYKKIEQKGEGDRIVFALRQTFDPYVAIGNEQLEGNEQALTYVSDSVDINTMRFATAITDKQLQELRVNCNLDSDIKAQLLDQADILNTKRILQSFALSFDSGNSAINPSLNDETFYPRLQSRILASNLDKTTGGVSRSRILIGNPNLADGNSRTTYATLKAALTKANFPVETNGMSVKHIRQLFNQASTGRSLAMKNSDYTVQESSIRPYKYTTHLGFKDKRYVLFIAPEAYNQLVLDPEWAPQTTRGAFENADQPSVLYGSMYKGTIEGVMVIVIPEFTDLVISNDDGNLYAYSVLCGACAIGSAEGGVPKFKHRSSTDYEHHLGLAHVEINGMKVLKHSSKVRGVRGNNLNLVEYGLIHSFTTIA